MSAWSRQNEPFKDLHFGSIVAAMKWPFLSPIEVEAAFDPTKDFRLFAVYKRYVTMQTTTCTGPLVQNVKSNR